MAIQIKSNGHREAWHNLSLKGMQMAVDGYIEPVYLSDKVILVNEEGLLRSLPVNEEASEMANQILVGDVLVLSREEWEQGGEV